MALLVSCLLKLTTALSGQPGSCAVRCKRNNRPALCIQVLCTLVHDSKARHNRRRCATTLQARTCPQTAACVVLYQLPDQQYSCAAAQALSHMPYCQDPCVCWHCLWPQPQQHGQSRQGLTGPAHGAEVQQCCTQLQVRYSGSTLSLTHAIPHLPASKHARMPLTHQHAYAACHMTPPPPTQAPHTRPELQLCWTATQTRQAQLSGDQAPAETACGRNVLPLTCSLTHCTMTLPCRWCSSRRTPFPPA
jgi:hypothetical protein